VVAFFRPISGLGCLRPGIHGFRRGLYSSAASRLKMNVAFHFFSFVVAVM
jgi:hypothetical protein